jgi:hypothetical protein
MERCPHFARQHATVLQIQLLGIAQGVGLALQAGQRELTFLRRRAAHRFEDYGADLVVGDIVDEPGVRLLSADDPLDVRHQPVRRLPGLRGSGERARGGEGERGGSKAHRSQHV